MGRRASDWTGRFELLLIGNGGDRDVAREALKNAGFGSPLPGVWVAPSGVPVPEEAAGAIRLEVSAEDDSGRRLLSESWPLDRTADAYKKFMKTFEPLQRLDRQGRATGGSRRLHRANPPDPPLPPRRVARSIAAHGAAAGGLAGKGGAGAVRRHLSRRCFRHPNNGLIATLPMKPGLCRSPARNWRNGLGDPWICYRNILHI